jgi:uncharacterized protein (DUF58 family)
MGNVRDTLLDADFVRELEVLRRRLEVRARSGGAGEHLAKKRGGASEFREHRAYEPGDDLRRIDWAAYARTGEPVLKVFQSEEEVVLRVACDGSASMEYGEPSKIDIARRISGALGYLMLARGERAELIVANENAGRPHHSKGRGGLPSFLRAALGIEPEGRTDLSHSIDMMLRRAPRPGMLALVSDFLDAGPVLTSLSRAAAAGHDLVLVHVLAKEEVSPSWDGDFALEDAETGEVTEVTMDAGALEAYALRFAGLCEELRAFSKKHRATYVRARTDEPLEPVIRRIVAKDVD